MSADDDAAERRREAARWFAIVDDDLRAARACLTVEQPLLRVAAYHCQQAAEKLIKGLLVAAGVAFRKTHDLDELADLAGARYPQWEALFDASRRLTVWGFAYRYPGAEDAPEPPPTVAAAEAALRQLEKLRAAAGPLTQ